MSNYYGSDLDVVRETQERTQAIIDRIDWEQIKKKLTDVADEVLHQLHYHVEETVANDAAWNLTGRINRKTRDIVDGLVRGQENLGEEVFGKSNGPNRRAIFDAYKDTIVPTILHEEIEKRDRTIKDLTERLRYAQTREPQ